MKFVFDEMISAPSRLGILATLVPGDPVSFTEMKSATSLSDGNLHVQTRKLADARYIEILKTRRGRRTVTQPWIFTVCPFRNSTGAECTQTGGVSIV